MADAVVSSSLFNQLSTFLHEESCSLLGGLRDEVQLIKDDAEDVLDEFIFRFGRPYGDGFLGRVQKIYGSIKNLKARHQIATKMRTIRVRITKTKMPYWFQMQIREGDLAGIERPKKKLMNMLFTSDSKLRVISVVGMGGLGKTTLVKKVYDDAIAKNCFKHHAFRTTCPYHLEEISGNIIERCADLLVLAIVIIGGVMAIKSRRTEEWDLFNRSLGEQLAGDE